MDLNREKIKKLAVILIAAISVYTVLVRPTQQDQYTESQIFTDIYSHNKWRGGGSGLGSKPEHAISYIAMLRGFISDDSIKTIADLGCGDWMLMEKIDIPNNKVYQGFDLVESVIKDNTAKYGAENIKFFKIDSINDFVDVKADLLIVKDVIQHWPNSQVQFFLEKILPNFKYALITNDYSTWIPNIDINHGGFRTIDLQARPFNKITNSLNLKFFMDYPSHGITKRVYLFENEKLQKVETKQRF